MSREQEKELDYLTISARVHAMEYAASAAPGGWRIDDLRIPGAG